MTLSNLSVFIYHCCENKCWKNLCLSKYDWNFKNWDVPNFL